MDVLTTEHKNLGSNPTINDRAVRLDARPTTFSCLFDDVF